jgi:hypothetical protein
MVEYTDKQNKVINELIETAFSEYHFNLNWARKIMERNLSIDEREDLEDKLLCLR